MSRVKKQAGIQGPEAFGNYYRAMHGDRWPGLAEACATKNRHFALQGGLLAPYFLDPASVIASLCLDIRPGQQVLDLCAAPGGKTLVLAQRLFGLVPEKPRFADLGYLIEPHAPESAEKSNGINRETVNYDKIAGFLVANELSANRRGRLRQVLSQHLPAQCLDSIKTSSFDATSWGQHEQERYDRILLDVPCSSERHLIQDPAYLAEWSPRRSSQLAQQAYAMGLSAGKALKAGGILLYCTCALSDIENDHTVSRIIERSRTQAERFGYSLEALGPVDLSELTSELAIRYACGIVPEATTLGQRIWPDQSGGFGPLYFARLQKVASGG